MLPGPLGLPKMMVLAKSFHFQGLHNLINWGSLSWRMIPGGMIPQAVAMRILRDSLAEDNQHRPASRIPLDFRLPVHFIIICKAAKLQLQPVDSSNYNNANASREGF
jgi:hypothetical protein